MRRGRAKATLDLIQEEAETRSERDLNELKQLLWSDLGSCKLACHTQPQVRDSHAQSALASVLFAPIALDI